MTSKRSLKPDFLDINKFVDAVDRYVAFASEIEMLTKRCAERAVQKSRRDFVSHSFGNRIF